MTRPSKTNRTQRILGQKAFAAMSAVEGLRLSAVSKKRLALLQADSSLTPDQRRAAILKAYTAPTRKK